MGGRLSDSFWRWSREVAGFNSERRALGIGSRVVEERKWLKEGRRKYLEIRPTGSRADKYGSRYTENHRIASTRELKTSRVWSSRTHHSLGLAFSAVAREVFRTV